MDAGSTNWKWKMQEEFNEKDNGFGFRQGELGYLCWILYGDVSEDLVKHQAEVETETDWEVISSERFVELKCVLGKKYE